MKKTAKKFVATIGLSIIILLVLAAAIFYFFGNYLIKSGIETAATKSLGVGVTVGSIDLSIFKGSVVIKELKVRNPAGYANPNLLELGSGQVKTKISSLLGNPVEIEQVKLDDVTLVLEQKGFSNNIRDILNSLPPAGQKTDEGNGKKLKIDELEINNITVKVKLLPIPGKSDTLTLHLTPIKMQNLGGDNKLDTGELSKIIVGKIAEKITKEGAGVLPQAIVTSLQASLDKSLDFSKEALKEGEELLQTGKEKGKEIIEGVKGLLEQKK
jgi:hypothetical protein